MTACPPVRLTLPSFSTDCLSLSSSSVGPAGRVLWRSNAAIYSTVGAAGRDSQRRRRKGEHERVEDCLLLTGGLRQPRPRLRAALTSFTDGSRCWLTARVRANKQTGRGNICWLSFPRRAPDTPAAWRSAPQVALSAALTETLLGYLLMHICSC